VVSFADVVLVFAVHSISFILPCYDYYESVLLRLLVLPCCEVWCRCKCLVFVSLMKQEK